MKKVIIPVLSGLALLIFAYGARQLWLLYNAAFKVVKTSIKKISTSQIAVTVYAEITNNSDISASLNGQHYDVFLNNVLVSHIDAADVIHVNSKGKTIIPISIDFNPSALIKTGLSNLSSLLLDRSKINIEIKGHLSLKAGIVELNKYKVDIKYTLQELVDIAKEPPAPTLSFDAGSSAGLGHSYKGYEIDTTVGGPEGPFKNRWKWSIDGPGMNWLTLKGYPYNSSDEAVEKAKATIDRHLNR